MAHLHIVVRHMSKFDRIVELHQDSIILGRRPSCGICLPDDWVSREHAAITKHESDYRIRDLGSRNGTVLNGQPLQGNQPLATDSEIQIGPFSLRVYLQVSSAICSFNGSDEETVSARRIDVPAYHANPNMAKLTPAQQRVYSLLLEGHLEKEVAAALGISIHTVHWHAKSIYSALAVSTRAELICTGLAAQSQIANQPPYP